MRRRLVPALASISVVLFLGLLIFGVAGQGADGSIDAQVSRGAHPAAPQATYALADLSGSGRMTLASLRGRLVLVNVFASWCGPCQAEAPVLRAAQKLLASRGGTVLGVTYNDIASDAQSFVIKEHIDYPVVRDVSGDFVRSFGATGVPETFLLDRRGRIVAVRRFQIDRDWVVRTLPKVLAEPS